MSGHRRHDALIAALLGFFIVMLDTTVVNVALSQIGADLGAAVTSLQWVVDAYALTFAALQLSAGSACDRVGARSVHLLGLVVFGLLSVACALAPTGGVLIASRALQGVGAAAIVPASLAILSLIHDRPADRARAIGLWGGAGGIAAAVGPVAGGLLVTWTGWRFVFWVNLPLIAITAWLTARCVPSPTTHSVRLRGGSDLPGQVLSVVGLAAATYGVIAAGESGWSLSVVASVLVGLVLLMVFVMVERIVSRPMLPTAVFSRPRFAVATTVGLALNTGFFGQLFVLSLFLQRYLGYEPWLAGLALAPQACSAVVASPLGGRVTARIGAFPTMLIGLLIGAAGFCGLVLTTASTPYPVVAALTFLGGFGTALTMPAATAAAVASAPTGYTGVAGSVVNAARQTGSVVGVAVLGSMIAAGDVLTGFHQAVVVASAVFVVAAVPVAVVCAAGSGRPATADRSPSEARGRTVGPDD
ncbi:MFS transporter [Actinomyces viscosus]|uniref:Spectinomycin tetracycline efflux pump n=1 Tax=Actinomyces viscosus TaxID=1656 RepID=A0A3S5EWG5_ACTVI|nr:MFS transporter [Actinomyces viscosus]TFH51737.1 MFS transporter [Actinomyces viscosus]VEI16561.1 Spectinomycin tetracycline efflux pump [Actinomyces viscosus]